ncbi:hypothetical protein ACQEUU_13945 [Nonomuraea sp. CA-218870]
MAAERGVTGVPGLVVDGRPPVPGVRPVADLRRLLDDGSLSSGR